MDCETLAPLIEKYLANELTPTTHTEVATHLAVCAACRALATDFAQLDRFLREMPCTVVPAQLAQRIQAHVYSLTWRQRIGHALPVAIATFCSAALFFWLAGETWLALQDGALWDFIQWLVNVPEIIWQHPAEIADGLTEFAPISGMIFTISSAVLSWVLMRRLINELRNPQPMLN